MRRELWRFLAPTEAVPGWEQKQRAPKPPPLEEGAQLQCHCERREEKSFPARLSKGVRVGGGGGKEKGKKGECSEDPWPPQSSPVWLWPSCE